MKSPQSLLLIVLLLLSEVPHTSVQAFSTGAGGCAGGQPAVQGLHLEGGEGRTVNTGSLAEGNLTVSIAGTETGGRAALDASQPVLITVDQDYTVTVTSDDRDYRGFLFRVESLGIGSELFNLANTDDRFQQFASACDSVEEPVLGITHIDNELKNEQAIKISPGVGADLVLDITVVYANRAEESSYYYSQFTLTAIANITTFAPTVTPPTPSPVVEETSPEPSSAPVVAPTRFSPCENICGFGSYEIGTPDAVTMVSFAFDGEPTTCAELQAYATKGNISPEDCDRFQFDSLVFADCGCTAPDFTFQSCNICYAGRPTELDAMATLKGVTKTCGEFNVDGNLGRIDALTCQIIPQDFRITCGCPGAENDRGVVPAPTVMPDVVDDVSAPTDSGDDGDSSAGSFLEPSTTIIMMAALLAPIVL